MGNRQQVTKGKVSSPRINSLTSRESLHIQASSIEISVEIFRKALSFSPKNQREARLVVKIENVGEAPVKDLAIDFIAPGGVVLTDPGMEIGTVRRHVRLPNLKQAKKIKFKLGLKSSHTFESGVLTIAISESSFAGTTKSGEVRIGLTTS